MSKIASPLLGYNNNVRHKNRVFHIQTEDSGVKHPHIITHLFMDGGRILKSIKRSYAEHVGADKMQDTVKQMMKDQHKAMFIALRDGQFDAVLEDGQAAKDASAKDAKEKAEARVAQAAKEKADAQDAQAAKEKGEAQDAQAAKEKGAAKAESPPPPGVAVVGSPVARTGTIPAPAPVLGGRDDEDMVPHTTRMPEMTLDIGAIERGAASPALRQLSDLPPPPANMFRDKSPAIGAYRASAPPETAGKRSSVAPGKKAPSGPPKKPASQPPMPAEAASGPANANATANAGANAASAVAAKGKAPSEGRYAAARPAAIFGQARPQQGSSIFGEDLISDKSLDEVILSYLAEDLEPAGEKKK
jgi:hypothetical protein